MARIPAELGLTAEELDELDRRVRRAVTVHTAGRSHTATPGRPE